MRDSLESRTQASHAEAAVAANGRWGGRQGVGGCGCLGVGGCLDGGGCLGGGEAGGEEVEHLD